MHKVSVGVLGASGYTGRELCSLIAGHPRFELAFAAANEQRGRSTRFGAREVTFVATEDAPLQSAALVFSALPHGTSAVWVEQARAAGARVVDLSSDLRPGNGVHDQVPYGLTELVRAELPDADVVANPGCYPTAILIALAPLFAEGLVPAGATIPIAAASGVTGAGATPRAELMFASVAENFRAYGVGNSHRHLAEMRATVARLGGDADLIFTPHLLPVSRGILATITVPLVRPLEADVLAPWRSMYDVEPFVEVAAEPPALSDVVSRNVVRISAVNTVGVRQPTLTVFSAIDNLMKGAAGQAVQNANAVFRFPEPMGLPA